MLISESFARRFHVGEAETLSLPSPGGIVAFPVAGVFYDYTRDQGTVFLSTQNFNKFWHDDRVNSFALYLRKDADSKAVADDFRERFSASGEFSIYSNRLLRTRIFEIFDQTFDVTYVLRTIAMLVALGRDVELRLHLAAARNSGVTREEIGEVLLQTAVYCGVPAAHSAFKAASV